MLKRAAVLALIALTTPGHTADFADAVAAFQAGDFPQAITLWRRLAEIGDPAAQNNLGFAYEKGLGVRANPFAAADWYRLAAEQDDAEAQVNLGVLYVTGIGVPRDLVEAHKWFDKAAQAGNAKAQQDLTKVVRLMTPDEFARARASERKSVPETTSRLGPATEIVAPADRVATKLSARPFETPALEPAAAGWRVQIASLAGQDEAEAERRRLQTLELLAGRQLAIVRANLPKGTYYRVQVVGLTSRAAANSLCAILQERNQDCFVVPSA